jgi:hypothetical protein
MMPSSHVRKKRSSGKGKNVAGKGSRREDAFDIT